MKTELFEEDQHDSHENISFDVEPEIKTEPDEQNFKKSQTNSKTEEDESRNWNFDEKLDKENYENCKKCDKLSKGESTEKLRHSRNCNELAGYFILLDLKILHTREYNYNSNWEKMGFRNMQEKLEILYPQQNQITLFTLP